MPSILDHTGAPTSEPASIALIDRVLEVVGRYGWGAAISAGLIYWLTTMQGAMLARVDENLKDHMRTSSFYARQTCINTAQNEMQARSCEPPPK